jgi:hypothetical protein
MTTKATHKTDRASIRRLTQLVNVGESIAGDLARIGVATPQQLIGRDPWKLYCLICAKDGQLHDPCLLDVLISAVDYMNGRRPQKWWEYTGRRKREYAARLRNQAKRFAASV